MNELNYVLITAARNEEDYIEKTIQSVIKQTTTPSKWIIVSDGSTDKTDHIVGYYAKNTKFINFVRNTGDKIRNFGSQVRAIRKGYKILKNTAYDFIGNLDADVSFDDKYFENILAEFKKNKKLGLAGGFVYEKYKGVFISRKYNSIDSVAHAVQLFRQRCFVQIGGYVELPYGGADWIAEVTARMNGWQVRSFPELHVYHHRHTGTSDGKLRGMLRQGMMDYSVGSNPLFELIKCMRRWGDRPIILACMFQYFGYLNGFMQQKERLVSKEFVKYLRNEQKRRLIEAMKI